MKIDIVYDSELDEQTCFKITMEDMNDYEMLGFIILEGDIINNNTKNNIKIRYVEYNEDFKGRIKIYGYETEKLPENFDDYNGINVNEFDLIGKCQFKLYRYKYFGYKNIYEQVKIYKEKKEKKKIVSNEIIQNRCFEILNDYINRKSHLLVYGQQAFKSLKEEKLQVLMISDDIIEKQKEKMKEILNVCLITNIKKQTSSFMMKIQYIMKI